jgi:hypothetical protein
VFLGQHCLFHVMATMQAPTFERGSRIFEVQGVHAAFKQVVDQFGRLFELEQERDRILEGMRSSSRDVPVLELRPHIANLERDTRMDARSSVS